MILRIRGEGMKCGDADIEAKLHEGRKEKERICERKEKIIWKKINGLNVTWLKDRNNES